MFLFLDKVGCPLCVENSLVLCTPEARDGKREQIVIVLNKWFLCRRSRVEVVGDYTLPVVPSD